MKLWMITTFDVHLNVAVPLDELTLVLAESEAEARKLAPYVEVGTTYIEPIDLENIPPNHILWRRK